MGISLILLEYKKPKGLLSRTRCHRRHMYVCVFHGSWCIGWSERWWAVEQNKGWNIQICPLQSLWRQARCSAESASFHLKQELRAVFTEFLRDLNDIHIYDTHKHTHHTCHIQTCHTVLGDNSPWVCPFSHTLWQLLFQTIFWRMSVEQTALKNRVFPSGMEDTCLLMTRVKM